MAKRAATLFWFECMAAALAGALALLTLLVPDWIEKVFGVEPDAGNGAFEWAIVAVLIGVAVALSLHARSQWHRRSTAASADAG